MKNKYNFPFLEYESSFCFDFLKLNRLHVLGFEQ